METFKNIFTRIFTRGGQISDGVPPQGFAPHEEFESRRTTKLGMVFVIIMVVTGIWQGQSLFVAISSSITPPQSLSYCYSVLVSESGEMINLPYDNSAVYSNYSYQNLQRSREYDYYGTGQKKQPVCTFSDIENRHSIAVLYTSIQPLITKRDALYEEKALLQQQLSSLRYSTNSTRDNYNTSLFETISQSADAVYSSSTIGVTLRGKEGQLQELEARISSKDTEITEVTSQIKTMVLAKKSDILLVADEYTSMLKWVELKRFLVSIILLAPLAFFTLRRYFRAKNERSEYAIIWAAVALVSTILSTQILVVFAYRIIPHSLIAALIAYLGHLFNAFSFLLVLLQWLGLILVPLFFGYLVYRIQKRYYNKEAVVMRALKDGKCPQCSLKIKDNMVFCPSCSYALRKPCQNCKHTSISYARFCEECGSSFVRE